MQSTYKSFDSKTRVSVLDGERETQQKQDVHIYKNGKFAKMKTYSTDANADTHTATNTNTRARVYLYNKKTAVKLKRYTESSFVEAASDVIKTSHSHLFFFH